MFVDIVKQLDRKVLRWRRILDGWLMTTNQFRY